VVDDVAVAPAGLGLPEEVSGDDGVGADVQAATAPAAPPTSPPRTARRVTARASTGPSIGRG